MFRTKSRKPRFRSYQALDRRRREQEERQRQLEAARQSSCQGPESACVKHKVRPVAKSGGRTKAGTNRKGRGRRSYKGRRRGR